LMPAMFDSFELHAKLDGYAAFCAVRRAKINK